MNADHTADLVQCLLFLLDFPWDRNLLLGLVRGFLLSLLEWIGQGGPVERLVLNHRFALLAAVLRLRSERIKFPLFLLTDLFHSWGLARSRCCYRTSIVLIELLGALDFVIWNE